MSDKTDKWRQKQLRISELRAAIAEKEAELAAVLLGEGDDGGDTPPPAPGGKVPTMVGFWEKSRKSDQMPYFGQKLVGFLGLQRNLEEFSRNSGIYLHDNV